VVAGRSGRRRAFRLPVRSDAVTGIRRPDEDGPFEATQDPPRGDGSRSGDDLEQWVAELRSDAAGFERTRRRSLALASAEEATVHAAITDLAEREEPVVVDLEGDRMVRGVIRLVGRDVVVLRDGRTETIARLDAISRLGRIEREARCSHRVRRWRIDPAPDRRRWT
jgi:hypothetical protein